MMSGSRAALAAIVLAAPIALAHAQTQEQDHAAHHPELQGAQPAQPPVSQPGMAMPGMKPSGQSSGMPMMGGNMGQMMGMMPMMRAMMAQHGMLGPIGMLFNHIEGRIAFLKAELGITDAQEPQWNTFADTLRTQAKSMQSEHAAMMNEGGVASWPDRLAWHERMLSNHLAVLKAIGGPAKSLYAVLSEQQRRKADELMGTPMGMM